MKTNDQHKTPEQEKKFNKVAPSTGGDRKQPVEEPTRKAGEVRQDKSKS